MARRLRPLLLALTVPPLLVGAPGDDRAADAAVLCRKKSGRVVVAERCGRKQAPLTAAELGLVGPPGAAGDAGAPGEVGSLPYRVVDAAARPVGAVLALFGDLAQVVVTHAALSVPIQLEIRDGVVSDHPFGESVRYEAAGCAGPPFIDYGGTPLPRGQLIGDTLYFATEESTTRTFGSVESENDSCSGGAQTVRGTCCQKDGGTSRGAPATAIPVATLGFTGPFTLETRP